jgi:hypothetical protein
MTDAAAETARHRAVATLYHAYLTGLILMLVSRRGAAAAGEAVFRVYRRHHLDRFLPALAKLGLADLPHAVACAQYHYLGNRIGGVEVEYMPESDRKAWVRFVHPRWIYEGTAICGVPIEVSRGMLRGWYAHNGVSLGNPRLGFVCTSEDMDGGYGLAGYFLEHDRELAPEERLRFAPGEAPPPFDPARTPALPGDSWPAARLQRANRTYAMGPVGLMLPAMAELFGRAEAAALGNLAGRLIGLQFYRQTAGILGLADGAAAGFAAWFQAIAAGQGDECRIRRDGPELVLEQPTWRLMQAAPRPSPAVFEAWNGLWEGALTSHDRFARWQVVDRLDQGDDAFRWRIRPA